MTIQLKIHLNIGNKAIQTWQDVAIALGLDAQDTSPVVLGQFGWIRDDNGNVVGHWGVSDATENFGDFEK